ncbi:MAG TPA: tyrosine--tRNA ligase [Geminicoccaceae bacterium]|nr:tyrosine--tRNA ligase [Geminicoccaceae bacterium]
MGRHRSEFVQTVVERGFLHQATDLDGLDRLAADGRLVAYIGFDCTADSLHVGHLVSIMLLRWLQRTGHRPIALIGGGTTKVGDPSGKDESRQLLDDATIAANIAGIRRSLESFLTFGDRPEQALLVNNADWLDELRYIPFLREYGRHFTVNRMLTFESVKQRLEREQPLTFLEFNYMIMQAYDFLELARRYDCRLQMGGSDQWGNIVSGIELGRRADGRELFGLTTPLITTATGAKMGKTAQGAVWLNPDRLSDFDYWQYWRNVDDPDVGRFLRLFTELPLDEIERLEALQSAELNEAKKILAYEATRLCRGERAAATAAETARGLFERARGASLDAAFDPAAATEIPRSEFAQGVDIVELFRRSGLVASKGEARRLIRGGGARLNEARIEDEGMQVGIEHLVDGRLLLSAGRKRHAWVRAV